MVITGVILINGVFSFWQAYRAGQALATLRKLLPHKAQAVRSGTVVTLERAKPNAAKIPNVCAHFGVPCLDFEGFLHENGWSF